MTDITAGVSELTNEIGQSIIYRSIVGGIYNTTTLSTSNTETDYEIKASVREYTAKQLNSLVQQGDREVRIAADDLEIVPKEQDKIKVADKWFTVQGVNIRTANNVDAIYIIRVRGGAL